MIYNVLFVIWFAANLIMALIGGLITAAECAEEENWINYIFYIQKTVWESTSDTINTLGRIILVLLVSVVCVFLNVLMLFFKLFFFLLKLF